MMKKGKLLVKGVLKAVERIARNEVEINKYNGPPKCIGIFHQPKRPKNDEN